MGIRQLLNYALNYLKPAQEFSDPLRLANAADRSRPLRLGARTGLEMTGVDDILNATLGLEGTGVRSYETATMIVAAYCARLELKGITSQGRRLTYSAPIDAYVVSGDIDWNRVETVKASAATGKKGLEKKIMNSFPDASVNDCA